MPEDISVTKFREYLRINTEQPTPRYEEVYDWLHAYAKEFELELWRYEYVQDNPVFLLKLQGTEPSLGAVLLYSHTDVVPTFPKFWTHDPYAADKDDQGRIYGRGAQDMKCVGVQYLEAYRRLRAAGKTRFRRTIYFGFGADEELGGHRCMEHFAKSDDFRRLNITFALDEGLASENDEYKVYYGERCPWWVRVSAKGSTGHGSRFVENDAGSKIHKVTTSFLNFRAEQEAKLKSSNGSITLGDLTSVNLTRTSGGVQTNVVPEEFVAHFDVRIPPHDLDAMEKRIAEWCDIPGVSYTFETKTVIRATTPITDDDAFWRTFSSTLKTQGCKFATEIFIGATDSRYLREVGVRSIGFSPMINTPVLLHDHDEYLSEDVYLRGVEIYTTLIENIANVVE